MAYRNFTLEAVETRFGLRSELGRLFPHLTPVPVPERLREQLDDGAAVGFATEKARSEFIIAPILLAVRRLSCCRHHQRSLRVFLLFLPLKPTVLRLL